jgi:hypothetical protein
VASEHVERELVAILATDVAERSRLAVADEIPIEASSASITTRICEGGVRETQY